MGGMPYELLLLALALIGYYEFARMHHSRPFDLTSIIGYATLLAVAVPWQRWSISWPVSFETLLWFSMFILLCMTVLTKNRVPIENAAQMWLGAFYIGIGFKYMMLTRTSMEEGLFWTLLLFAAIWSSDIGAYFTGRALGSISCGPPSVRIRRWKERSAGSRHRLSCRSCSYSPGRIFSIGARRLRSGLPPPSSGSLAI